MGGGPSTKAIIRHIQAGFKVYAMPEAAATINDDLMKVGDLGVIIQEEAPPGTIEVELSDLDIPSLRKAFGLFGMDLPGNVALALQDHGFSPHKSNRLVRFEHLARVIKAGGRLDSFAYQRPPEYMTRMWAAKSYLDSLGFRSIIMDTGPAALLGATLDPRYQDPGLVVNFGNGHTVAAVVSEGRVRALFEHHTSELPPDKIRSLSRKLCNGTLTNDEVFEDGGHGAYIEEGAAVQSVLVTGPRRDYFLRSGALEPLGQVVAAAPGGDMMIAGCIGLIEAWKTLCP
jgi:uncharacterized protein (DUF1786 family)